MKYHPHFQLLQYSILHFVYMFYYTFYFNTNKYDVLYFRNNKTAILNHIYLFAFNLYTHQMLIFPKQSHFNNSKFKQSTVLFTFRMNARPNFLTRVQGLLPVALTVGMYLPRPVSIYQFYVANQTNKQIYQTNQMIRAVSLESR